MTKTMLELRRLGFALVVAVALCLGTATITCADPIYVTLLEPTQTGTPGSTLTFRGNMYNAGPPRVVLNAHTYGCAGPCSMYLNVGRIPLNETQTTGEIDLFTVSILPNARPSDVISGFFIAGDSTRDVFADAVDFHINVVLPTEAQPVPEPAAVLLVSTGLAGVAAAVRRRRRSL